jgi:acyl dehydratase
MSTEAPAKDTDRYFEEIEDGEQYTVEQARTITETDVVNFAGISGDFHPYHMSKTRMEDSQFGGRIAHGALVFSISEALIADMSPKAFTYGHDAIRFPTPTMIGDTLTVSREIIEREGYNDDYGKVVYAYEATNQDGETLYVGEHTTLVERRSEESNQSTNNN